MKGKREPGAAEPSEESANEPAKQEELPAQTFKFRLKNAIVGELRLPVKVVDRLWRKVQRPDDSHHFIVFADEHRRFALNIRHVVASQFDPAGNHGLGGNLLEEDEDLAYFYLADSPHPLRLRITPDAVHGNQPDGNDAPSIASFFDFLERTHRGLDIAEPLRVFDGSTIWLRLDDISFVSVPLRLFAGYQDREE
jgi:hypothetical protein